MVLKESALEREVVEIDGEELDVLHNKDMTDEEWANYKEYLQRNPYEARQLLEEHTNPDKVRKTNITNALADSWRASMDDDPDDFARKIKALEEDGEFSLLFDDIKSYRWDEVHGHLMSKELMCKVSKRMGGVPKDAKAQVDKERKTPMTLQEAAKFGDIRAVQSYISQTENSPDQDVDAFDHRGITCLGYAVGANRQNIAQLLIDSKANPKRVDLDGNSALHYAAGYGRRDMLEYLINLGLDLNAKNNFGQTPLDCATKNRQKVTIQELTSRGAQ
mmetsp:Transcript_15093/g.32521  ORF Transcript_15093/g.32521 Transcript_15093/m.32521 type:complete len:276 (+) Transcript_15093:39-866(+)